MLFALKRSERGAAGQKSNGQSPGHGIKKPAAGEIDSRIFSSHLRNLIRRRKSRKRDRRFGANLGTGAALNAFLVVDNVYVAVEGDGLLRAGVHTSLAADAVVINEETLLFC